MFKSLLKDVKQFLTEIFIVSVNDKVQVQNQFIPVLCIVVKFLFLAVCKFRL